LLCLEDGQVVVAKMHQLSITGGLLHLAKPLDDSMNVELMFHIGASTVRNKAQMLLPMWATQGCMQPFRFDDFGGEQRWDLETNLHSLLHRNRAPSREVLEDLTSAAPAPEAVEEPQSLAAAPAEAIEGWGERIAPEMEYQPDTRAQLPPVMEFVEEAEAPATLAMELQQDNESAAPVVEFPEEPVEPSASAMEFQYESERATAPVMEYRQDPEEPVVPAMEPRNEYYEVSAAPGMEFRQEYEESAAPVVEFQQETDEPSEFVEETAGPQEQASSSIDAFVEPLTSEPMAPSQVVLYFDTPADSLHFTLAASDVISGDRGVDGVYAMVREIRKAGRIIARDVSLSEPHSH
jgi:hypothetical protein